MQRGERESNRKRHGGPEKPILRTLRGLMKPGQKPQDMLPSVEVENLGLPNGLGHFLPQ